MQETQLKVFLRDSAEYRSSLEYRLSNALTFVDSMNNLDPKITKDCDFCLVFSHLKRMIYFQIERNRRGFDPAQPSSV